MNFNPTNTLKNSFINFVRYFYDPNLQYASHLKTKWIKSLIPLILDIFLNGLVYYIGFFGIVFIFPKLSPFIFLGNTFLQIISVIFLIGIIIWVFEERYEYFRGGYKK